MRLIFVHLGDEFPTHLQMNINRSIELFPNIPIVLIVNSSQNMDIYRGSDIEYFYYQTPVPEYMEKINSSLDLKFRRGFWVYSLMRLDAIVSYMNSTNPGPIIHVESDVILMPNFPWDKIQLMNNVSWTRYNSVRDSAALIYFPELQKANEFSRILDQFLRKSSNATDMSVLSRMSHTHLDKFEILPALENPINALVNSMRLENFDELEKMSKNFSIFNGIFDAAAIGMWLTGQDPKNSYGSTKVMSLSNINNGDSAIDPSKGAYKIKNSNLFLDIEDSEIPIWNLHIHSKNLKLFGLNWEKELRQFVHKTNVGKSYDIINRKLLLEILIEQKLQGTLFRFLINMPYLVIITRAIKRIFKKIGAK